MRNPLHAPAGNDKSTRAERLYYLDWMRVFAILVVFLHHCAKIFDYHTSVVFNDSRSLVLSAFREFNFLWIMPLFFVISGASVYFSFRPAGTWKFVKSKIRRLLIPLLLIGTFLINPVYVFIERLFDGKAEGSFFGWYPHYFEGMYGFGGNFMPLGMGDYLWYLQSLFVYSLILLPLFMLSKKTGKSLLSKLSVCFEKPWALFLLFLPISASAAAFEILGMGDIRVMGDWDPGSYLLFFIYGYLIFSNAKIQETITKHSTAYLAAALFLTALYLDSHFGIHLRIPGVTRHDLLNNGALHPLDHFAWAAVEAFRGLLGWCWILGLLGLGRRFLNFKNSYISRANEGVLPFYILHHSVIYVVGFYVIQWSSGVGIKFFMISVISFMIIVALYEIPVRRIDPLRFLFGMKPVRSA